MSEGPRRAHTGEASRGESAGIRPSSPRRTSSNAEPGSPRTPLSTRAASNPQLHAGRLQQGQIVLPLHERDIARERLRTRTAGAGGEHRGPTTIAGSYHPPPRGRINTTAHRGASSDAARAPEAHAATGKNAQSPETRRAGNVWTTPGYKAPHHAAISASSGVPARATRSKSHRRRLRGPQHQPVNHQVGAHAVTIERARSNSASPRRNSRHTKVYCSSNKLDPSLRMNGGTLEVGTRSQCFRSGFGAALWQHIEDEEAFIKKFSVPYEPLVPQRLWYKDSAAPPGYQPTTLSQARQCGWGAGSAALARKLRARRHGKDTSSDSAHP